uniref:CinA family nicotinamide mononucleotide deamidase-related protein n=1 Tax=Thaumasiovibrio occultus TaxID=1891184 RepID=UPI000B363C6B|nr:CinA family nicotinamide mononucleotide deamidase-related protein [Thaumasiovibrio occultus]
MLSTGEEVLYGDITDTNAAWLSRRFMEQGLAMVKRVTVGDSEHGIAAELSALSRDVDVVIVNGGLGPTSDDVTAQAAATAAGVPLVLNHDWVATMEQSYAQMGREMPATNLKQAMLPQGAEVLDNPIGTACGFTMTLNKARLFFTPGVPKEFFRMVEEQILPKLVVAEHSTVQCYRWFTFGLSESGISQRIADLAMPAGYQMGYRSALPYIEVKIFGAQDTNEFAELRSGIAERLGDNVISVNQSAVSHIGQQLVESNLTLSVAEQFSAGGFVLALHDSDQACQQLAHGWLLKPALAEAFSESDPFAAVMAMAEACREKTGADLGIASGSVVDNVFSVGLATPHGEFGLLLRSLRQRNPSEARTVLVAVMLDVLRRYLAGLPLVGEYESFKVEGDIFLPAK